MIPYFYACDCKSRAHSPVLKPTKVNPQKICLYCGYYAVLKEKNPTERLVKELHNKGYNQYQIGKRLNLDCPSVRYHLLKLGLSKKNAKTDTAPWRF